MRAGIDAKAAGKLVEVADPATVAGCRDLGEKYEETSVRGARGRLEIRSTLKSKGRARGASHVRYFGYAVLDFNGQGERGHFYDCALTGLLQPAALSSAAPPPAAPPVAAAAPGHGAAPAEASVSAAGGGVPVASVSTGAAGTHKPGAALSGQFELVPVGALQVKVNDQSREAATGMAYGVSANLETLIAPNLAFGLNPGVTLGLKDEMATAAATQFDLRARVRVGTLAVDGLGAYLYGTAGVSWLIPPNDGQTSSGGVVGIGAGVTRHVERSTFVTFELGYQFGFQDVRIANTDIEQSSQLFHLGFGIGWDL